MVKKNSNLSRQLGQASTAGTMLAACVIVGLVIGLYLDRWLNSKPWMMFLFLFLGIIAGFYNLFKIYNLLESINKQK